jgi:hypothetical protein
LGPSQLPIGAPRLTRLPGHNPNSSLLQRSALPWQVALQSNPIHICSRELVTKLVRVALSHDYRNLPIAHRGLPFHPALLHPNHSVHGTPTSSGGFTTRCCDAPPRATVACCRSAAFHLAPPAAPKQTQPNSIFESHSPIESNSASLGVSVSSAARVTDVITATAASPST